MEYGTDAPGASIGGVAQKGVPAEGRLDAYLMHPAGVDGAEGEDGPGGQRRGGVGRNGPQQ